MATKSQFYADLGLESASNLQVDGNATITGNLTVNGTSVTVNSSITSVADSMLELANGNTSSDTLDIGFYGNYDDGLSDSGATEFTGLFRDATDSTWKLFDGLEVEPGSTVNITGTGYALADILVGDLTATTITATNSITGASIVFPTSDGTSGQVIKTNGSGTLSFGSATLDSLSDCTISSSTPNATTNPPYAGAIWIEEDTGDVYVCTNATTNNNTWVKTGSADGIVTSGSTTIIQSEDDTNVIHVNNSAEVGIGTASPTAKLHVESNGAGSIVGLRLKNANTTVGDGAKINFTAGTSTEGAGIAGYGTALNKADLLFFAGGNTERMRILADGDVLIGQTSQTGYAFGQKLVVGDGDANDGITIQSGSTHQGNLAFNHSDGTTAHGRISYQHNTNYMQFFVNNSEKMRILTSGGITFNGDTTAANALDDYEEGTWTPVLQNVTTNSSTMYGIYTKIGNICHIHAKIAVTLASLPGSNWNISGLPFTSLDASDSNQRAIITIGGDCVNLGGLAIGKAHFRTNGTSLQGVYLNSGTTAYWTYNTMDSTSIELNIHGHYTTT